MRMAFKDTCKEVLPTLSKLSGIPKSRLRVGTSEAYSYLTSFILASWMESGTFSGWWFFFIFTPYLGKIPILTNIFQMGWNHQPVFFWKLFTQTSGCARFLFLPKKSSPSQPSKCGFTSTVSTQISGCYSAQCKFLSIIGVSPAVVGDTPDEFSCNNVVVGGKRYTHLHTKVENLTLLKVSWIG